MSDFPKKKFAGELYSFDHLQPMKLKVHLNADGTLVIDMTVEFGCHCFTEEFVQSVHRPDHRYTYKNEVRAFDMQRYNCSLQLPRLVQAMQKGVIYNAQKSYTYSAQIDLSSSVGKQSYSIFFSLTKDNSVQTPALKMFVKSAYLKPLVSRPNAQNWRFVSLAGQISGAFPAKTKNSKPQKQKKKAPQGLFSES